MRRALQLALQLAEPKDGDLVCTRWDLKVQNGDSVRYRTVSMLRENA